MESKYSPQMHKLLIVQRTIKSLTETVKAENVRMWNYRLKFNLIFNLAKFTQIDLRAEEKLSESIL